MFCLRIDYINIQINSHKSVSVSRVAISLSALDFHINPEFKTKFKSKELERILEHHLIDLNIFYCA